MHRGADEIWKAAAGQIQPNGPDPDWAERRYWLYIDAGYAEQPAFDEVCAELEAA